MQHCVGAPDSLVDAMRIADIAGKHFEPALYVRRAMVEPTPGVKGVVKHKGTNFMSLPNQLFRQVRTDEAVGAGNKDLGHFCAVIPQEPFKTPGP